MKIVLINLLRTSSQICEYVHGIPIWDQLSHNLMIYQNMYISLIRRS